MAEIRSLLVGLLIFSGIMLSLSTFWGDLTTTDHLQGYGYTNDQIQSMTSINLSSKSVANDITAKAEAIKTSVEQPVTGVPIIDTTYGYAKAALEAVQLPLQSIDLFTGIITDTEDSLGLPSYTSLIINSIIILIVVFAVLSAYLKWKV